MKTKYIDHLGDDLRVVNAARVSFNKESKWEALTNGN
jgi:thymidylate synthase (FAD)